MGERALTETLMFGDELEMSKDPHQLSLSQELFPKVPRGPFHLPLCGFSLSISLYIKFPSNSNYLLISPRRILTQMGAGNIFLFEPQVKEKIGSNFANSYSQLICPNPISLPFLILGLLPTLNDVLIPFNSQDYCGNVWLDSKRSLEPFKCLLPRRHLRREQQVFLSTSLLPQVNLCQTFPHTWNDGGVWQCGNIKYLCPCATSHFCLFIQTLIHSLICPVSPRLWGF